MAIEAISQVAEDHGIVTQGYTLQTVKITSPLVLPLDGGVEILLSLWILSDLASDNTKLFDFRISSVSSSGRWTEHVTGRAALEEVNTGTFPIGFK